MVHQQPWLTDKLFRYKKLCCFLLVTALFCLSQAYFFQGFVGTDDLHYAILGAKILQGSFSPFEITDVFSGRMLLVFFQAILYEIGGISTFTTQLGSYLVVISAAYITIFHLLKARSSRATIIAASLFYFNPVIAEITLGPSPDVCIMLSGVLMILFVNKLKKNTTTKYLLAKGVAGGIFVFCTLFIKETRFIFLPFLIIISVLRFKKNSLWLVVGAITSFAFATLCCGWFYYIYTSDFFFRVHQIQYAAYDNPCTYNSLFQKEMLQRLTYGVWNEFVQRNFYPVLLATVALVLNNLPIIKLKNQTYNNYGQYFLVLLLLSLYFPFSLGNYQPLCFRSRHFLFLLPLAVVVSTQFLETGFSQRNFQLLRVIIAAVLLAICVKVSLSGWYWNFYRCLIAWFTLSLFFINKKVSSRSYLLFVIILWLYLPYNFIFFRKDWFKEMKYLKSHLEGEHFYIADHNNYMHWHLLSKFQYPHTFYNLDKWGFEKLNPYTNYKPDTFHAGWFIVNKIYTVRSTTFLNTMDSLKQSSYFSRTRVGKNISAYYLTSENQLSYIYNLILEDADKVRDCN